MLYVLYIVEKKNKCKMANEKHIILIDDVEL